MHTLRFLYDVTLLGGALRAETDGTTDTVTWYPFAEAMRLTLMPFVAAALSKP